MRKFLAIFLTVAMLASFAVVPAFAAAGDISIKSIPEAPLTAVDAIDYTGKTVSLTKDTSFKVTVEGGSGDADLTGAGVVVKAGASTIAATGNADGTIDVEFTSPAKDDTAVITVTIGAKAAYVIVKYGEDPQTGALTAFTIKSPTSPLLVEGNTLQLEVEKTPKNSLTGIKWYSSDAAIATVGETDGIVTGVKDGKVTITAVSTNGLVQKIDLIVVKGADATSVAFNKATYTIGTALESKVKLDYTVTPSNAKTNDLTVTGLPTEITFSKASGELEVTGSGLTAPAAHVITMTVNGKSAYATLIIEASASASVAEVTLDNVGSELTLAVDQKFQLKATAWDKKYELRDAKPVADAAIEFVSSNTAVAKVDKNTGVVTAVAKGTAKIYTVYSGVAAAQLDSVTINVVDKIEGSFAYVKSATVKVRALPSSSALELDTYKNGQRVTVLENLGAWTKIKYYNSEAFIASAALITPTDFTVTSSSLAVRAFVGAKETVKTLKFGDVVRFVGLDANNKAWAKVLIDNSEYYVAAAYITESPLTGVVLSSTLTMRVSASTTSAAYANKLVKGQVVEIVGKEGAFLKVKTAEGFVGYAAAAYITIF